MTRKDQIKILDDKIKANNAQYDLDRMNAEISAYSSGDLPKYEYLTKKDLATSSPAHLFAIRGRQKRSPGTLQTRDQNLPK